MYPLGALLFVTTTVLVFMTLLIVTVHVVIPAILDSIVKHFRLWLLKGKAPIYSIHILNALSYDEYKSMEDVKKELRPHFKGWINTQRLEAQIEPYVAEGLVKCTVSTIIDVEWYMLWFIGRKRTELIFKRIRDDDPELCEFYEPDPEELVTA